MARLAELSAGRTSAMTEAAKRRQAAAGRLSGAAGAPINRKLANPGQRARDVFGGSAQTGNQNRALLEAGLSMMDNSYAGGAGRGMSRGIRDGLSLLDDLREGDRDRNIESRTVDYKSALDDETAAGKLPTSSGVGSLLTDKDLPSSLRAAMGTSLMTDDEKQNFQFANRTPQIEALGGGLQGMVTPSGGIAPILQTGENPNDRRADFSQSEASLGRAVAVEEAMGKGQAGVDLAFQEAMRTEFPQTIDFLYSTRELLEKVKAGETQTGLVEGRIAKYIDPETALLNTASIEQAVKVLQSAKLQPVSDKEFATIQSAVANILAGKEVNIALLERALAKAEREIQMRMRQAEYFRKNQSLMGWEMEEYQLRMEQLQRQSTTAEEDLANPVPPTARTGRNPNPITADDLPPLPE